MRTKRRPWWISCSIYVRRRRKTMGKTPIEWSQMTWNPIVGCSIASTGCAGCYAVPFAWRFMHHPNEAIAEKYKDTVRRTTAGQLVWTGRSEEHTSELQSLMRISYAVFCLKKKNNENIK